MKSFVFFCFLSAISATTLSQSTFEGTDTLQIRREEKLDLVFGLSKPLRFESSVNPSTKSGMTVINCPNSKFYTDTAGRMSISVVSAEGLKVEKGADIQPRESRSSVSKKYPEMVDSVRSLSVPIYRALIIAIQDYKYSSPYLPDLKNPVKDAEKLTRVLIEKYSFNKEKVTFLKNPDRQEIIDVLEKFSFEIESNENLLIFYAGHGFYDKQKQFGYWLPSDARIESRSGWIPNSTIKDYISAIPAKHTLLISDACFSGSIFRSRGVDENGILQIYELYKNKSRKAITSGNLTEVPDESIFSKQLLRKLEENSDAFLSAQKLFAKMYEPIINNSPVTPQFGIIQDTGDEGGDFIFLNRNVRELLQIDEH